MKVKGIVQVYQNRAQFTVHKLRRLEEHEIDFADYFPCSDRDTEEMFAELQGIVEGVCNPHLRALLQSVLSDPNIAPKFKLAPAAKNIHHACRGGLLEHVLSLCNLGRVVAGHYKTVDLDLLITAAVLHDIGKIEELTYARSFGYSTEGQLLGHIVIALRTLTSKFDAIPGFPARLRTLVEHMIISHHGELEFGSPKVPGFPEALLFHQLDTLDSKMEAMRHALKRDTLIEGEFTGWVGSLERVLLKKDRYLGSVASALVKVDKSNAAAPTPETVPEKPKEAPAPQVASPVENVETRPADGRDWNARPPEPITPFGQKLQAVLQSRK